MDGLTSAAGIERAFPLLRAIAEIASAHGARTWLVGGALRDMAMGRPTKDADLVVEREAESIARDVARLHGAAFVPLHDDPPTFRLVREGVEYDLSEPRGPGIEDDLSERDLTINAMAASYEPGWIGPRMDPYDGAGDLARGLVRAVRMENLFTDPLRVVRVFRFQAQFGFRVEPVTLAACRRAAPGIADVAAERVWEEVRKILLSGRAAPAFAAMTEAGALAVLLPDVDGDGAAGRLARWERLRGEVDPVGDDEGVVVALACVLAARPDKVSKTCRRLKTPARVREGVARSLEYASAALEILDSPSFDTGTGTQARRSLARLTAASREAWRPAALAAAAVHDRPAGAFRSLDEARRRYVEPVDGEALIDGRALMAALGIPAGPRVGALLARIREERVAGTVTSLDDALAFARALPGAEDSAAD